MLAIDTWQALNAFYRGSYSCLLPSGERGWMPKAEGEAILSGVQGLAPCWVWGGAKPHGLDCVGYFWEMNTSGGHYDTPTCIQCVEIWAGEIPLFACLLFMYAVKNGYHVQLGVSLRETSKPHFCKAGLAKEKAFFCQSLCSLNCVAWLYINFSNHRKTSKPRGRKFTASDGSWAHEFGETHKCAFRKSNAVQWEERTAKPPEGVHGVSETPKWTCS